MTLRSILSLSQCTRRGHTIHSVPHRWSVTCAASTHTKMLTSASCSRYPRRRPERTLVLLAFGCLSWSQRSQGISGKDHAQVPAACWRTFCLWRYVRRTCLLDAPTLMLCTVLYAVGIVELELESASAFILLLFVIPLAFTLSGFLLWIIYSLNGEHCLNVFWTVH